MVSGGSKFADGSIEDDRRAVASREVVYGFDLIRGFAPALG
jgi:hypothetical protein